MYDYNEEEKSHIAQLLYDEIMVQSYRFEIEHLKISFSGIELIILKEALKDYTHRNLEPTNQNLCFCSLEPRPHPIHEVPIQTVSSKEWIPYTDGKTEEKIPEVFKKWRKEGNVLKELIK